MSRRRSRRADVAARPRRIAFLHDNRTFGGIETLQVAILRHLDRSRFEAIVVHVGDADSAAQFRHHLAAAGVDLIVVGNRPSGRAPRQIVQAWRLARTLRQQRADVTHIQTRTPFDSRALTVGAALAGVQARVRTEHVSPGPAISPVARWRLRPFDLMTHLVVTDSRADQRAQIERVGRSPRKVAQTYCGIDADTCDPLHDVAAAKARLGIDPSRTVIGTVGRLHEQKGTRYLVEAVNLLAKRRGHEDYQVVIVGDGPDESELRALAGDGGTDTVVDFVGFQSDPRPFMEAMDIAVMPSLWEGFSISMQEFMALGKAMVVSDHASFLEAMTPGEHCLVVPMRDAEALADAVESLLDDPDRRADLGAAACTRLRANFSLEHHVDELMAIYDRVLAEAG